MILNPIDIMLIEELLERKFISESQLSYDSINNPKDLSDELSKIIIEDGSEYD